MTFVEEPSDGRVVALIIMSAILLLLAGFAIFMGALIFTAFPQGFILLGLFTLLTSELGPWEITKRALYLSTRWITTKSWNLWRIGRLRITEIIFWAMGRRNVCRFELQCVRIYVP